MKDTKNSRKNKGITLIALVITIIVMLILVTVTINIAVNGGLFNYAQESTKAYDTSKEKELIEQAKILVMFKNKDTTIKKANLDDVLNEVIGEDNYISNSTEEGIKVTFNASGRTYIIEYDEQIKPEYFYIYKCSDCSVERVLITDEIAQGYDITKKVSTNYYYGGYYSTYGGTETDVAKLTYVNNIAIDEDGEIYNCTRIKTSKNVRFWTRTDAYTQPGNNMIPEDGKVYYLYEFPNTYLTIITAAVPKTQSNNQITDIIVTSVIDTAYQQNRGIDIAGNNTKEGSTIIAGGSVTGHYASGDITIRNQDFQGVNSGYVLQLTGGFQSIAPDMQFTVTPYIITYDGIKVSAPSRTYNTGNDGNGVCTTETFHEVIN